MNLRLNSVWTEHLLKYPEKGMGYQRVDIKLKSGEIIENCSVLNAEDLILPENYSYLKVQDIEDLIIHV